MTARRTLTVICTSSVLIICQVGTVESTPTAALQYIVPNTGALLLNNFDPTTTGVTIFLQGYNYPGDGGGGLLSDIPSPGSPAAICMEATGTTMNGSYNIKKVSPFPIGLSPGMGVTGPGIPSGTAVASYSVAGQIITMNNMAKYRDT